jgi:peptide deformylase
MSVLPVLKAPHKILITKTKKVEKFDESLNKLIEDMIDTMRDEDGCGLAANQVGVSKQIMITSPVRDEEKVYVFVNPEIIKKSEELCSMEEGCLSVPGGFIDVERPESITLSYQTITGEKKEEEFSDFHARAIQHEIDHLEGRLIIDYISRYKRDTILRKIEKLNSEGV